MRRVYNDTARAPAQIDQIPLACNLTGPGGWLLLFFETIDGGASLAPRAHRAGCTGFADGNKSCACATDGRGVTLSCGASGTIAKVDFASIGTPHGKCGALKIGTCNGDPAKATAYVASRCVGKSSCSIVGDITTWNAGRDPCYGTAKSIAVQAECSAPTPPPPPPGPPRPSPPAAPEQWQVDALRAAVACGLRPIVRLGQRSRGYRYNADTAGFRSYKALGRRYAQYVAALLDGAGIDRPQNVTVLVGNEPNICVEWECWEPGMSINISTMAAEWAAYTEDVFEALSPLGVQLAASPMAPGGNAVCGCCSESQRPAPWTVLVDRNTYRSLRCARPQLLGKVISSSTAKEVHKVARAWRATSNTLSPSGRRFSQEQLTCKSMAPTGR